MLAGRLGKVELVPGLLLCCGRLILELEIEPIAIEPDRYVVEGTSDLDRI